MSTPHNSAEVGQIAPYVLMPGDPKRAEKIALDYFENPEKVSEVRGILAYTGTYQGKPMTAMASGMGIPSMMIYATELFRFYGVKAICRVGTCGVWADDINVGDVIIGSAAHTDSAVPRELIPHTTVALAPSWELLSAAAAAASKSDAPVHIGPILSSDSFYNDRGEDYLEALTRYGALGVEMEGAGLYAVALREKGKALTVLTASDHLRGGHGDMSAEERENCYGNMVAIAAEAMLSLE